jgi:3'-phosphoadenosine 5'-phosphosulfate sulfotransferase (PAPS reductase)/FAD synthetase
MNAYTRQDLAIMQAWPLERKIRVTQTKIIEWYYRFNGCCSVSFSGGLDSTVLLDLARRAFPDIPAVFVCTGLEYPEIMEFVKSVPDVEWLHPRTPFHKVIEKYGFPAVSKDISKRIYYARKGSLWAQQHLRGLTKDGTPSKFNERYMKWAHLVDAPFLISDKCCYHLKEAPLERHTKQTGRAPIIGTLACESVRRQSAYLKTGCNAFRERDPKSTPMGFWMKSDILTYLKLTGIPYSKIYGDIITDPKTGKLKTTGADRTGCMYCLYGVHMERKPNRFQRMAAEHPKHYDYCINRLGCGAVLDYLGVPYKPVE